MTSNNDVPVSVNTTSFSQLNSQIPDALTEVTAAEHLHDPQSLTTCGPLPDVPNDKPLGVGAHETSDSDAIKAPLTAVSKVDKEPELTAIDKMSVEYLDSLRSVLENMKYSQN